MTRRKKIGMALTIPVAVVLLLLLAGFQTLSRQDAEHAKFYNTGKTVNDFLKGYCGALEQSFEEGNAATLAATYARAYASPGRGRLTWAEGVAEGDVVMRTLEAVGSADFGRAELEAELAAYLDGLTRIDKTTCKIVLIEEVEFTERVTLTVKFILDGVDGEEQVFQDRMTYRWHLLNEAPPEVAYTWRIERDELVEGIRVLGQASVFADTDPEALGIDFVHERDPKLHIKKFQDKLEFGVIQHASGGISAVDYDQDGRNDLLFLSGTQSRLYRNLGNDEAGRPQFADATTQAGLEGIGEAHSALFADYDNDGDRDLFVGRYLAPNRYYRNEGPGAHGQVTFTDVSSEVGIDFSEPVTSATLLDYDADGDLDIYLAMNGNAFEAFPRLPFFAQNAEPNRLLRNESGRGFTDVTESSGVGDVGWSLAVAALDYDADGDPDLAVANDFGRKSLYRNDGPGSDGTVSFTEVAKQAGVLDFSGGMGVAVGDFDDDGLADLYMSNINSNQRWFGEDLTVDQYVRNVVRSKWILSDFGEYRDLYDLVGSTWTELGKQIGEGNSLFRNTGDGGFEELKDSHTDRAGWGWSVAFFDYDNDTDLDLYAANGWISNTPETDL